MKPHIRWENDFAVWSCYTPDRALSYLYATGVTPFAAYCEWLRLQSPLPPLTAGVLNAYLAITKTG